MPKHHGLDAGPALRHAEAICVELLSKTSRCFLGAARVAYTVLQIELSRTDVFSFFQKKKPRSKALGHSVRLYSNEAFERMPYVKHVRDYC